MAVYCIADGKYKIFDSHAGDHCDTIHFQGTCVLLDLQTLNTLLDYIQEFYRYSNLMLFLN